MVSRARLNRVFILDGIYIVISSSRIRNTKSPYNTHLLYRLDVIILHRLARKRHCAIVRHFGISDSDPVRASRHILSSTAPLQTLQYHSVFVPSTKTCICRTGTALIKYIIKYTLHTLPDPAALRFDDSFSFIIIIL